MTPTQSGLNLIMRLCQHGIDMHGFSVVFEIVVSLKAGGISKVNRILRDSEFDLYFATVLIDLPRINSEKYIGNNS